MIKKVNIIGAGLAGLSAGIYLQKNGVETEIFELAGWAGGVCTAWVRQGYRFDGCIHWMVGTKPDDEFYKLYLEVGALEKDTVIYNPEFVTIEVEGVMYNVPLRIAEFKAFLYSISPQDSEKIDAFCRNIETMIHTKMPVEKPSNPVELMKIVKRSKGFITLMLKYHEITIDEFSKSFQSHTLRSVLCSLMSGKFSISGLFIMLGTWMSDNAGYPMGGALDMIKRMEDKYRSLGGKISFYSKVDEIVVEDGKAAGIRSNGFFHPADAVIAACDVHDTLKNMLGDKYRHPQLNDLLESAPLFAPLTLVSFGLKRRFDIPYSIQYEYPEGLQTAPGVIMDSISIRSFDFDPSAAPENCSSVMVTMNTSMEYWKNLRDCRIDEYRRQKQQLADTVANAIDGRIPGFKDAIAVVDVATPATYMRLANLYKASYEGFAPTPIALRNSIQKTIPGVNNLVLCGQWTTPGGGICSVVLSGWDSAQLVFNLL